jgi:putative transposase
MYPVVFFDALLSENPRRGLGKEQGGVSSLGYESATAPKRCSGFGSVQSEGAKFWLAVMNELKNRGVQDVLIAVIDGLKGFPEAITAVFPDTEIQTCIVHLIRNSLSFCNWKQRQPVAQEREAYLQCRKRGARGQTARGIRRGPLGPKAAGHRAGLAAGVGTSHSVFCLPARDPDHHLHHQRYREPAHATAQGAGKTEGISRAMRPPLR